MSFFKGSANCCSSRKPPSPDGFPTRPAVTKSLAPPPAPRSPRTSWTAEEAAEIRAIFEEDDKEAGAEIVQVRQCSTYKLKEILLGDDSKSESGSELLNAKKNNSMTLTAVTQKLKQHLSRESGLNKRHSKSSIGTSEEEVERRAELRRIRQKRIKEELSNEGLYDDDAKSLSTVPDVHTADRCRFACRFSWSPGEVPSLPSVTPLSLKYPMLSLPVSPPLQLEERHEAVVLEVGIASSAGSWRKTSRQLSFPLDSSTTMVNSTGTISRRHSLPIINDWEPTDFDPAVYVPTRKVSSPLIPPKPVIEARRLSSIAVPGRSSWRLSFNSTNRGDVLRKLSQEHAEHLPVTMEHLGVTPLPMRTWLHSQGLRSSSQAVVSSEADTNIDSLPSHAETCTANNNFGGVDGGVEAGGTTLHLHEMGISQRLASSVKNLQSSASSPQLSSWGSHNREASSSGETRPFLTQRPRRLHRKTDDSDPLSQHIPQSWGTVLQDGTSSFYPSANNSMQSSPQGSRYNLASLLAASRHKFDASEMRKPPARREMTELIAPSPANDSFLELAPPLTRQSRRPTIDDSSLLASETASFCQREAELSVIPKRFASLEKRPPSTPRSSRFREEFDLKPQPAPNSPARKPSRFYKLKKRLTLNRFDGPKDMEDLLSIPVPNFAPKEIFHSGGGPMSPRSPFFSPGGPMSPLTAPDNAASLWGMAVKSQAERKASAIGHNLHLPEKKPSQELRKKSAVEEVSATSVFGQFTRNLSWGKKKKVDLNDHVSAAKEYQKRFQERVAVKEQVMDSWEAEMEATASKAKAKSKNIVKKAKPTGPDKRYPATWARYPSHSRSERSASATRRDRVDATDFAVAKTKEDGEALWYHSEKKHHLYHHDEDYHPSHEDQMHRDLKTRVDDRKGRAGDKISYKKHKLKKLTEQGASGHARGRRSSLTLAGRVEFPELEILPITIRTQAQQEQDIHEEEREKVKEQRRKFVVATVVDGSAEDDDGDDGDDGDEISINDPRFYDDCIAEAEEITTNGRKQKFRTWSGRGWYDYASGSESTRGGRTLRKSTDEYHYELKALEKAEREKVLLAAERAWGEKKRGSF